MAQVPPVQAVKAVQTVQAVQAVKRTTMNREEKKLINSLNLTLSKLPPSPGLAPSPGLGPSEPWSRPIFPFPILHPKSNRRLGSVERDKGPRIKEACLRFEEALQRKEAKTVPAVAAKTVPTVAAKTVPTVAAKTVPPVTTVPEITTVPEKPTVIAFSSLVEEPTTVPEEPTVTAFASLVKNLGDLYLLDMKLKS